MDAMSPRRTPPRMFPTIIAMRMLENGSPKMSDPSAKSAIVRLAPNQRVKTLKGCPCLFSSSTCSIPSFSKWYSRIYGQSAIQWQDAHIRTYVRISYKGSTHDYAMGRAESETVKILRENGHAYQSDLVRATGFSRATISEVLANLENRKIVRR